MNIIVILSIVPDTETKIQLNDKNVEMDQSTEWIINPYDEYAIEAAIQFKEKHGGEITSISFANGKEENLFEKPWLWALTNQLSLKQVVHYPQFLQST